MTDQELKLTMRQALDGTMPPLPDDPALTGKVLARYAEKQRKRWARMTGLRLSVAFAVMVLFLCSSLFTQGKLNSYLEEWESNDEQHHYLQGVNVTTPIQNSAEAATAPPENIYINTTDWNEIVSALGESPLAPTWLPEGWHVFQYYLDVMPSMSRFCITYEKYMPSEEDPNAAQYTSFDSMTFFNMDDAYIDLEQNEAGTYLELENGLSIYMTMNFDRISCLWTVGQTFYTLSTPLSEEDALHIIRSLYDLE